MPNKETVLQAIEQFETEGEEAFLDRFASGWKPKAHYLRYSDRFYPLKAIWSAAHEPQIHNREFATGEAARGLQRLGFETMVQSGEAIRQYLEGEVRLRESSYFARNPKLAADAKDFYKCVCQGCMFDFGRFYGSLGEGYIECHHLHPISKGDGKTEPKTLDDVTVLCANCHRMVHRERNEAITLEVLRKAIETAKNHSNTLPGESIM